MKTFKDLKAETTKEILGWMFELVDDKHEFITMDDALWMKQKYWSAPLSDFMDMDDFIILLHHTVEKVKANIEVDYYQKYVCQSNGGYFYYFTNYQLTQHLTACEMAIWDCLISIYKEEEK